MYREGQGFDSLILHSFFLINSEFASRKGEEEKGRRGEKREKLEKSSLNRFLGN